MRRLIVLVAIVVLTGAMLASAAFLDVDGGALQTFRFDVDIDTPAEVSCVDDVAGCEDREQPTDGDDTRASNEEEAGPSLSSTTTTEGSTSTTSPTTVTTHTTEVTIKVETTVTSQPPDSGVVELP